MTKKSPTRTVRICKVPDITVRIDSEPRTGLPWKRNFKHTVFRGTVFIDGEQMGRGQSSREPRGAVEGAIAGMYSNLLEDARKVDTIRPFYKSGNMRSVRDGTSSYRPYWLIEGTHEETT